MKLLLTISLLFISTVTFSKDRVECKSIYGVERNTPSSVDKIVKALNESIKNPEHIIDISTSAHTGTVVVCVVIRGE